MPKISIPATGLAHQQGPILRGRDPAATRVRNPLLQASRSWRRSSTLKPCHSSRPVMVVARQVVGIAFGNMGLQLTKETGHVRMAQDQWAV